MGVGWRKFEKRFVIRVVKLANSSSFRWSNVAIAPEELAPKVLLDGDDDVWRCGDGGSIAGRAVAVFALLPLDDFLGGGEEFFEWLGASLILFARGFPLPDIWK